MKADASKLKTIIIATAIITFLAGVFRLWLRYRFQVSFSEIYAVALAGLSAYGLNRMNVKFGLIWLQAIALVEFLGFGAYWIIGTTGF